MATRFKPVLVADLVARFLSRRHGHPQREREATTLKVFSAFQRIGPPVTEQVEPAFFKQGVLTLTVSESAWLTELTFLKPEILERLNRALGREVVVDLRMRLGRLMRRGIAGKAQAPVLSAAEREKIEAWGAMIPNPSVREAMIRAASRSVASGPPAAQRARPPEPRTTANPAPAAEPAPRRGAHRDRWAEKRDRRK